MSFCCTKALVLKISAKQHVVHGQENRKAALHLGRSWKSSGILARFGDAQLEKH